MSAGEWNGLPGYTVQAVSPVLGERTLWHVMQNNAVPVATFYDHREAERDAARRNFGSSAYPRPDLLGM